MFHEDFKVFGIHVYLRNSSRLLCARDLSPLPKPETDFVAENQGTIQILIHDNVRNTSSRAQDKGGDIKDGRGSHGALPSSSNSLNVLEVFRLQHCRLQLITCTVLLFMTLLR